MAGLKLKDWFWAATTNGAALYQCERHDWLVIHKERSETLKPRYDNFVISHFLSGYRIPLSERQYIHQARAVVKELNKFDWEFVDPYGPHWALLVEKIKPLMEKLHKEYEDYEDQV